MIDRRLFYFTCVIAVVTVGFTCTAASGQSSVGSTDSGVGPTKLAAFLAQDLGISGEQALARLAAGQQWSDVGNRIMDHVGDRYAGAEIEYANGVPIRIDVHIVEPTVSDALQANGLGPLPVNVVAASHSLADLEAVAREIAPTVGGTGRILLDFEHNSLILRPEPNVYEALRESDFDEISHRSAGAGVAVRFAPLHFSFRPDICNINECDPPIRGGSYLTGATTCTAGYVAVRTDRGNNSPESMMTAGHCIGQGPATWKMRRSNGTLYNIGTDGRWEWPFWLPAGSGPDWGFVDLNGTYEDPANSRAWIVVPGNSQHGVTSWGAPAAGEAVCLTGRTSGSDCGTVTGLNSSHLWETVGISSAGGDSGGPIYDGGAARGIHDGSGANNSSYFTDVKYIWNQTGGSTSGTRPRTN